MTTDDRNRSGQGTMAVRPSITLNAKQARTFAAVFSEPTRADIAWEAVVALVRALGGEEIRRRQKTAGSRVRFQLNGQRGFFHKPHPETVLDKGCVAGLREFFLGAGVVAPASDPRPVATA